MSAKPDSKVEPTGRTDGAAADPHTPDSWALLMARGQAGDKTAYGRLLREITPFLRAVAARHCRERDQIEDIVQDILLTVHQIRQTYDPARPFGPWLVAIARRRAVDQFRRRSRVAGSEIAFEPHHEAVGAADAVAPTEAALDARDLHRAIEGLPAGQRQAVKLLKLRQLSLKEASAESGLSIAALKVAVHRGIKALRAGLTRESS